MAYLLDTSVLARLVLPADPVHALADEAMTILLQRGETLYVTPQVLIELRSVATRPAGPPANGMGMTSAAADAEADRIQAQFGFLPDTTAVFPEWKQLASEHQVMGRNVHDARLAAVMRVYGISHILTLNGQHFRRFPGIIVVDPSELTSRTAKMVGKWVGHAVNEYSDPHCQDTESGYLR